MRLAKDAPARADVRLWAGWLLLSLAAGLVALGAAAEFPWVVGVWPSADPASTAGYSVGWAVVVGGALAGAVLGGAEWWVLRRWFRGGRLWVLASAAGFALSFTVAWAIGGGVAGAAYANGALPNAVDRAGVVGGALIGLMFGGAQWLVLRAQTPRAAWWLAANVVGFAAAWAVVAALSAPVYTAIGAPAHFWGGAVFGLVCGAITGAALLRLVGSPDEGRAGRDEGLGVRG